MEERDAILHGLFLFDGAPGAVDAVREAETVSYGAGDVIYNDMCFRKALGVVLSGRAEAVSPARDTAVLSTFGPGAVFGAAALFGMERPYVSCVRAVTDCAVLFLPEELLRRLFVSYPQTALNYIAFLSSRVRLLNNRIAVLAQNNVEGRLYRFMEESCDQQGRLPGHITMTRLAAVLGMGRTSLYRALDSLEKQKLIVRRGKTWEVIR